jgi:hypothetical protein
VLGEEEVVQVGAEEGEVVEVGQVQEMGWWGWEF